jgi:hypothetical protein
MRHQTASFSNNTQSTVLSDITSNYLPVDIHQNNSYTTITINRTIDKRQPLIREMEKSEEDWDSIIMEQASIVYGDAFK